MNFNILIPIAIGTHTKMIKIHREFLPAGCTALRQASLNVKSRKFSGLVSSFSAN